MIEVRADVRQVIFQVEASAVVRLEALVAHSQQGQVVAVVEARVADDLGIRCVA